MLGLFFHLENAFVRVLSKSLTICKLSNHLFFNDKENKSKFF
ncbi:MAG: hypothetical protein P1U46_01220 [Patescibacteria group bacterium]|nr:hypothetical protein [Patescibacteria group bacterium]